MTDERPKLTPEIRAKLIEDLTGYFTMWKKSHAKYPPQAQAILCVNLGANYDYTPDRDIDFFPNKRFEEVIGRALKNRATFLCVNKVALAWLQSEGPIPPSIRKWISGVISGEYKTPDNRGKSEDLLLKRTLVDAVLYVEKHVALQRDANLTNINTDCIFKIVFEAARNAKYNNITLNSIRNAYANTKFEVLNPDDFKSIR